MKRVIAVITSFLLIISILLPLNETVALANDSESEFTILKNTSEHKTFKFKNGETLEQFNKDDEVYFIANTEEDSFKIVKENDVVSVINIRNDEVVETYTAKETMEEGPEIGTYALIQDPGNGSKYRYKSTRNMSLDIISTSVSVVAGVIASFLGTPVTGAITTIATGYVGSKLKKLYWKEVLSEYREGVYQYRRWANIYYKYHDYTGNLGSTHTYTKNRVM